MTKPTCLGIQKLKIVMKKELVEKNLERGWFGI